MAAVQRKLVHKQFNSPMGLYSQQNVKETLDRELKAFGSEGIEVDEQLSLNLANSAVLRAVEEEEQMKCEMFEPSLKTERQSRSRQRLYYQRPHTPVHQHQLEQIKSQYLSHQHDITIDRDTVLKINRLATRRNLHKREHSWPPTTTTTMTANNNEQLKNVDEKGQIVSPLEQQHIRSTSHDNDLLFDETVCKRHGIDIIREKFNSPTRIIEPTAQEVRAMREKQRKLQQQKKQQQQKQQQSQQQQQPSRSKSDDAGGGGRDVDRSSEVTKNKPKQMINLLKHEELLRKTSPNKSATMTNTTANAPTTTNDNVVVEKSNENIAPHQSNDKSTEMEGETSLKAQQQAEDELFKTCTLPLAKGFSHPETKAADEDIGLVEPKRQYYEQLSTSKKWYSYENLMAAASAKPVSAKPLTPQMHRRQAYSLERGREARQRQQLPPQKPRVSPKLQRRSMKLATEIKISYDADAQQHNIQVKSLNQPKKPPATADATTRPPTTTLDDLEHIPLPATPDNCRAVPVTLEQSGEQQKEFDTKTKSLKDQQIYDDSCIYLRSIDLQDNTVAYIPAAITIVPSPTEEIMQHWMESSNLKANIKGVNDIETAGSKASHDLQKEKNENLISMLKQESVKSAVKPEGIKKQQKNIQQQKQQQQAGVVVETKAAETDTYVTRLPSTPNGIQLTRQTSVNTKRNSKEVEEKIPTISTTTNLARTTEAAKTHATPQQKQQHQHETQTPGVKHLNATTTTSTTECNKIAKEIDKPEQQGVYYTDGEYIYGPYDPYNGAPLANATVRSLEAEQQEKQQQQHHQQQQQQQLHQHENEIKKNIEAETKTQHKNEIANLTAKYEHIQKSINEHLRQIDAYIENAKAALKSTIATGNNKTESSSDSNASPQNNHEMEYIVQELPQTHYECHLKSPQDETPLKEILRKITNIMQEVKPLHRNQNANKQETNEHEPTTCSEQQDGNGKEENMPIVDKVLMDLNRLTEHLTEFDRNASEELKPIMEQLQQKPLDLQFETRPTATTASHVLITEETTDKDKPMETAKSQQLKETHQTAKPAPPPPPLPPPPTTTSMLYPKSRTEKRKEHIGDEQLLATDKLITTAQIQSQQQKPVTSSTLPKEMTMSALTPKDKDDTTTAATKDKMKNLVFDFITARHDQEQLVGQVIDTLEKLENETKENLVNIHVPPAHDEQIKSNLNQQTPTESVSASSASLSNIQTIKEKDIAIMQNCNISVLANASGKYACNHDNHVAKSTKGNESQLKLHIKDFADKIADKQFHKYDNQPPTKNTNDVVEVVVNTNSNNNKPGQRQHKTVHEHNNKHVSSHQGNDYDVAVVADEDDKDNKIKNMTEQQQQQDEEGDSNHSSASELSNTYKSSYELPSPYVTTRQISWEDVQATATQTSTNFAENQKHSEKAAAATKVSAPVLTSTVNIVKPKHDIQIAQICTKSPVIFCEFPKTTTTTSSAILTPPPTVTTSGHVEMQSTTTLKPRIQTRKQPTPPSSLPHQQQQQREHTHITADEGRKYPAPLIEPHLPTRSTSPFGLNPIELPFKQGRSPSVSPTRLRKIRIAQDALASSATRKYPSPLVEPHLPTRAASPFGLNAVQMKNLKRSASTSPSRTIRTSPRTVDEMSIRKYPAPLVEPHVPTRAASPFGLNAVDVFHLTRATTPMPSYGLEVKNVADEQEQEYYGDGDDDDEHEDKPISPIRKYPPALIEPHVPTRAASPFGLNPVEMKQQKAQRHRTPSPARGHHHHQHPHSHQAATSKSASTVGDSSCNKTIAYVPQVEGHNIGLLVRTSTPIPGCTHTETISPTSYVESEINATKTPHDYVTMNTRDISGNKYYSAKNDMGRDAANVADDDEATCDELQRINTIGSTKQGTITTTATAAATKTMAQPQKQEQQHHHPQHAQLPQQQQEQYSGDAPPHMTVDMILLPTSVINRSFDNVSPRPYISIEGYKRVAWPPASEERIVREFTPQPQTQFPPAPGYNQQQHQQQQPAAAVPPTQDPNYYNNVQQHHNAPINNNYNTNNHNNFARENNSPYKQTETQNQNQPEYEAFPPQTPETPIILKDKQFSRLPSHEPNSVPYQQQQQQYHQQQPPYHPQQQQQQYQQPQNPQQQHYHQEQPQYQQPLYNQQNYPHHQQQQHHQQYQPNQQNVAYPQQQQQQPHYYPQQEEQHHQQQTPSGWKPIRPPQAKPDTLFTGAYGVRETTPTVATPIYQQQFQNYHQQQQYRAPSHNQQQQQYQQPPQHQPQQQQQYPPQPQYQAQAPVQNQYQQQPHVGSQYQQPPQQQYQQPAQQPAWAQQQQQYQQPPWVQQQPQQQQQQPQYQNPSINQYNQAPHHQQPQQQHYPPQQQQNQFVPQTNQQQFNSYSQPQQQQHTVSHDQVDQQQHYQPQLPQDHRGASPGIITLRKEAPITQKPAPVYSSQPAATSYRGGSSMRGDLKWPPPEYKEAAAKENEERRKLALGPVCRPRKVNRDYTTFFAKNALSHHYPSYKVPPGTQHMIN